MKPRYFTDGVSIWCFAPGKAARERYVEENEWHRSAFKSLEEFLATPGEVREIPSQEGDL